MFVVCASRMKKSDQLIMYTFWKTDLKQKYLGQITFWGGGCDAQILTSGTAQAIKEHIVQNVNTMNHDGGFIFQQVHNVLANVSPQNIITMFNTVLQIRNHS